MLDPLTWEPLNAMWAEFTFGNKTPPASPAVPFILLDVNAQEVIFSVELKQQPTIVHIVQNPHLLGGGGKRCKALHCQLLQSDFSMS